MKKKLRIVCLVVFLSFSFNAVSFANAIFETTAAKNVLELGETVTIGLWANIEEQTSGQNGINAWQLDMVVDVDNVVAVVDVNLIAPSPMDPYIPEYMEINTPYSGNLLGVGAAVLDAPKDSDVGVGGFSLLANITIQAIGVGEVTYDLSGDTAGFYVWLRDYFVTGPDGNDYNCDYEPPYEAEFQSGNNVFTVVPEPGSFVLLATMAGFALRSRKTGVGK